MKSLLFASALVFSSFAFANEPATYEVKGMHCGSCKSAIEAKVCKMEGVESCNVEVTNAKKQTGKLTLKMAEGQAVDTAKVQALMSEAGDYKLVTTPEKKKK